MLDVKFSKPNAKKKKKRLTLKLHATKFDMVNFEAVVLDVSREI